MNGSEFVALIPNILEDNIKDSLDKFIKKVKNIEELKNNINFALCKYENEDSTRTLLTKWIMLFLKQKFIQKMTIFM